MKTYLEFVNEDRVLKKVICIKDVPPKTLWDMVEDEEGWWGADLAHDTVEEGEEFDYNYVKVNTKLGSLNGVSHVFVLFAPKHYRLGVEENVFHEYFKFVDSEVVRDKQVLKIK
jgi:hypothetical protein